MARTGRSQCGADTSLRAHLDANGGMLDDDELLTVRPHAEPALGERDPTLELELAQRPVDGPLDRPARAATRDGVLQRALHLGRER